MTTASAKKYKLYHRLSQPESADIRRLVKELGIIDHVQFANVEVGESDIEELRTASDGRESTPTLRVDGSVWVHGRDAILRFFGR